MYLKGILLSLVLLCLIAGGRSEPQCALSVPALLKSGEMERVCLEVKRHTKPVNVNILLEVGGVNHTIFNEQVPIGNTFKCPEFQVPNISSAAPVFITINAVANNFNYTARRAVVVAPTGKVTLLQLERTIYKPGQKARFNVVALDNNLKPVEDIYPRIYITDPSGNRLFQWVNQKTTNSILTLIFEILPDPELGLYQIYVEKSSGGTISKSLSVEEYVLPNFGCEPSAPNAITILDKKLAYKVTCTYTYGQGVPGKVAGTMCRPPINYYYGNACNRNPDGLCVPITGVLDANGTFTGELDTAFFQPDRSGYSMSLNMKITATEDGSGIQVTESRYISITNQLGRVSFNRNNMDSLYKKGIPYYVEVIAVDGLQNPLKDQVVELQVDGITVKNLTTDANGKAWDLIDTTELEQSTVSIQIIYKNSEQCYDSNYIVPIYSNDYYQITRFYSRSGSFVHVEGPKEDLQCGRTYNLTAKYIFDQSGLQKGETTINYNYMVMSRAKILSYGKIPVNLANSLQGKFTITIQITPAHVPSIDIVVYSMLEKEVVAHTLHLNTEKCFSNQVHLQFLEKKATPGSTVNLNITASPRSMCAVRLYDSSLLLLRQDQPLTAEMVYSALQYSSLTGYYVAGYNVAPPDSPCVNADKQILIDGLYYSPVNLPNEGDVLQQLSNVGMLLITNATLQKPTLCGFSPYYGGPFYADAAFVERPSFATAEFANVAATTNFAAFDGAPAVAVKESMRTSFPDVWFFDKTRTGDSGSVLLPLEVPGTITKWNGDGFCLDSKTGFGLSKYPANITSFQEFFVADNLPYSFVRGETLIVRVMVSNYLPRCAKVRATIAPSKDYTVEPMDKVNVTCVCYGQRAYFSFSIKAKSLGELKVTITGETVHIGNTCEGPADPKEAIRRDTIVKSVIVESEGIRKEVTKSTFVCVNGTSVVIPVNISPPENSVSDATKARVTVIGDIVGRALVNPESLINEPTGCGEQNLGTLMPISQAVDYLNVTGRLTNEMKSRAEQFMAIGYMRQMRYRNPDGSFSAFSRGPSSSWLTLLTLNTLLNIKRHLPNLVEDKVIEQAMIYLERLKDPATGAFKPQGTLFNNGLKGAADNDVGFTAMMTAVLLQTSYLATPTLLRDSLKYLDGASRKGQQSVYNYALLLYAFRMAGNVERSKATFDKLKEIQIEKGGTINWERPIKPNKPTSYIFPAPAASAEVQITSIVLMALTAGPSPFLVDLAYLSRIALWISQQQTGQGSFSTTADTVAALQALCSYGALVYQKDASNIVKVQNGAELIKKFNLDSQNRNLLQTQPLPYIPGNYSVTVSGNGCVLVQTTVGFNIPVKKENSAFLISVSTPPESCVNGVAYNMPININVSYHGLRNESNMALIKIALPSGYSGEYKSVSELKRKVSKVEQENNYMVIYLDSVTRETTSLSVNLQMGTRVQNHQPKDVSVWDYYEREENGLAVLRHPCSK